MYLYILFVLNGFYLPLPKIWDLRCKKKENFNVIECIFNMLPHSSNVEYFNAKCHSRTQVFQAKLLLFFTLNIFYPHSFLRTQGKKDSNIVMECFFNMLPHYFNVEYLNAKFHTRTQVF